MPTAARNVRFGVIPLVAVAGLVGIGLGFLGTFSYLNQTQPRTPVIVESESFKSGIGQSKFMRSGWHYPESWGTWSSGPRAELEWKREKSPANDPLVTITGRIFPYVAAIPQKIRVVVNETPVAEMQRNDDGDLYGRIFRIPRSAAVARNPMKIVFEISHPTSPSSVSNSTDNRMLGLGLEAIELSYEID